MANSDSDGVTTETTEQADEGRRGLMALALGLFGAGALAACSGGENEILGTSSTAATGLAGDIVVTWVDTVLGSNFPTNRSLGDLATKTSTNLDSSGKTVIAIAKGCLVPGDGGGGVFYWSTGVAWFDDGGTVIVPGGSVGSSGANGCWVRIFSGALNVRWFGAKGDGATADTGAVNQAIAAANAAAGSVGASIYFPRGKYLLGSLDPITADGVFLTGDGAEASVLLGPSNATLVTFGNASGSVISRGGMTHLSIWYTHVTPAVGTVAILVVNALMREFTHLSFRNARTIARIGTPQVGSGARFANVWGTIYYNDSGESTGAPAFDLVSGGAFWGHNINLIVSSLVGAVPLAPTDRTTLMTGSGAHKVPATTVFVRIDLTESGRSWDTLFLSDCIVQRFAYGLYARAGSNSAISFVQISNSTFDECGTTAAYFHTDPGTISNVLLSNCCFVGRDECGVALTQTSTTNGRIQNVTINNVFVHDCGNHGILIGARVYGAAVSGAAVLRAGRLSSNSAAAAFRLEKYATAVTLGACTGDVALQSGASPPWQAPYGVSLAADCDGYTITGNAFYGATASSLIATNSEASTKRLYSANADTAYVGRRTGSDWALLGSGASWTNRSPFRVQVVIGNDGTSTSLHKNGVALYLGFGTIELGPGESFSVGYTAAPNANFFVLP